MMIIGVDYHPSFQTIAFLMEETGECGEQELNHSEGQAEKFYRDLQQRGIRVRVGLEATGYSRWFERLLAELGIRSTRSKMSGNACQFRRSMQHHLTSWSDNTSPRESFYAARLNQNLSRAVFFLNQHSRTKSASWTPKRRLRASVASTH